DARIILGLFSILRSSFQKPSLGLCTGERFPYMAEEDRFAIGSSSATFAAQSTSQLTREIPVRSTMFLQEMSYQIGTSLKGCSSCSRILRQGWSMWKIGQDTTTDTV